MDQKNGAMIVGGDYRGDLEAIRTVLNKWRFDKGIEPFYVDGNQISAHPNYIFCPKARPEEQLDSGDWRRVELSKISEGISPFLVSGTLELVAVGYDEPTFAHLQTLTIRSNGFVQLSLSQFRAGPFFKHHWRTDLIETYDPSTDQDSVRGQKPDVRVKEVDEFKGFRKWFKEQTEVEEPQTRRPT